jgi:hypothetical protein
MYFLIWNERWVTAHIEDADKMGIPLIVEEFGKAVPSVRSFAFRFTPIDTEITFYGTKNHLISI